MSRMNKSEGKPGRKPILRCSAHTTRPPRIEAAYYMPRKGASTSKNTRIRCPCRIRWLTHMRKQWFMARVRGHALGGDFQQWMRWDPWVQKHRTQCNRPSFDTIIDKVGLSGGVVEDGRDGQAGRNSRDITLKTSESSATDVRLVKHKMRRVQSRHRESVRA